MKNLKIDLKCKAFYLLLCIFFINSLYSQKNSTNTKISISLTNVTLVEVFSAINEKTNYTFSYGEFIINNKEEFTVNYKDSEVEDILNELSSKGNFDFTITNFNVILREKNQNSTTTSTQKLLVQGTVVDENNLPIPNVNIVEKGTSNGTVTNFDGEYAIQVENTQAKLEFTYVGFKTQMVEVNGQNTIDIVLKVDEDQLDEVVVVGYGTQKQKKVSTSISSVSMNDIQDFPVSNFDQALAGKMAGVQVLQTSGEPGRELDIRVRGIGSITSGVDPLYVVDGVPLDNALGAGQATEVVAMEDIESIQVLKDAASVAIYGSRGANGVILITTKRGNAGKMSVNFNQSTGFQNVSKKIDMMNAYEYAQLSRDGHNAAYLQDVPTGSPNDPNSVRPIGYQQIPLELFPYLEGQEGLTDTDWQDEIFRTAIIERYNISLSGGDQNLRYFVSAIHSNQEGVIINSDYAKTGIRANLDLTSGKFNIGFNFSQSYTVENRVNANGPYFDDGIVGSALKMSPTWPVFNPDGGYNYDGNGFWRIGTDYQHNEILNPVALANEIFNEIEHYNLLTNLYVDYEVIENLNVKSSFAIKYNAYQNEFFRPSSLQQRGSNFYNQPANPEARLSNTSIYNWLWENTVTYKKQIHHHNLDFLGGITAQKNRSKLNRSEASVTPDVNVQNAIQVINADGLTNTDASINEWSLYSLLARVQYDYKNKYLFTASIRADASSRFAPDNKWGYFPSVSAGWRISQEEFLKNSEWISELKLRTSYGKTGNFSIGDYRFLSLMTQDNYVFGNPAEQQNGFRPNSLPNSDLTWETTEMVNLGLDFEIVRNQVGLTVDMYNANSFDLLLDVPVPNTTGFNRAITNIGKVNNRGIELDVRLSPNLGEFKWNSNFNIAFNRNEVKELGPSGTDIIETAGTSNAFFITRIGESIGSYYLLVQDGIFANEQQLNQYPRFNNTQPGDFRFVDVNNDGVIDVNDDRAIVGNYAPDFIYGFSTSLQYKGFDFNMAFQGSYGGEILNLQRRYIANSEGNFNNMAIMVNRWQSEENPGNLLINRANRKASGFNGRTSTWHIEDGSYLRLQNISLGYSFAKSITDALHIDRLRLYVVGNNIYTWSDYSGYNPEVNLDGGGDQLTPGLDYGVYPLASTYSIGFNVSF